jgi:CheY-like chemotaxis protein
MATILVVDDEAPIRNLLVAILTGSGHTTITAINGLEAVAVYRSNAAGIDLVITDMTMPVLNGAEAIARIRETNPSVPIIVMSGYTTSDVPAGTQFLPKPFTAIAVRALVQSALGEE